jgi:hypothetical protein
VFISSVFYDGLSLESLFHAPVLVVLYPDQDFCICLKSFSPFAAYRGTDKSSCSSLAHAELYMALASVFRNFSFELYKTDITDVELAHDFFLPSPKMNSEGVRVRVKKE